MIVLLYDLKTPLFNANSGPSEFVRSRRLKAAGNQDWFDETGGATPPKLKGAFASKFQTRRGSETGFFNASNRQLKRGRTQKVRNIDRGGTGVATA